MINYIRDLSLIVIMLQACLIFWQYENVFRGEIVLKERMLIVDRNSFSKVAIFFLKFYDRRFLLTSMILLYK